jgi:hypothetical protein
MAPDSIRFSMKRTSVRVAANPSGRDGADHAMHPTMEKTRLTCVFAASDACKAAIPRACAPGFPAPPPQCSAPLKAASMLRLPTHGKVLLDIETMYLTRYPPRKKRRSPPTDGARQTKKARCAKNSRGARGESLTGRSYIGSLNCNNFFCRRVRYMDANSSKRSRRKPPGGPDGSWFDVAGV